MIWNDRPLTTMGEMMDEVVAIAKADDRAAAKQFMQAYLAENPHAAANIGYGAGYCDPDTARKIWDVFECAHPVFGTAVPSSVEAFDAGRRAGEACR